MSINNSIKNKIKKSLARKKRVRAKISGSAVHPRLCVFKSNQHIWAQLVDDVSGKTLASADDSKMKKPLAEDLKDVGQISGVKSGKAFIVGKEIAKKAKSLKIESVVFDRGGFKYHGRVKMLAQGARNGGLKF